MKKKLLLTLAVSSLIFGSIGLVTACEPANDEVEGNKNYEGEGEPDPTLGKNGDTYLDTLTNTTYIKVNGNWEIKSNSNHYEGSGIPNNAFGEEGDTFTDTSTGDKYVKQGDKWILTEEGNLIQKHTVTFDLNGGKLNGASFIDPVVVKHGEWVDEPIGTIIKKNAKFVGWYDGEFKWNFHSPVNGDLYLVAKYESTVEESKVSFTVDPNNGEAEYTWSGIIGDYPKLPVPSKDGYEFVGWYIESTDEKWIGIANEDVNGQTLVAKFIKANFNFKFELKTDTNTIKITGINNVDSVSAVIPDSFDGYVIDEIAENAFGNRISLESVSFGPNIKICSPKAFLGCRALKTIEVTGGSIYYKSVDGVLYNAQETELVFVPQKASPDSEFNVPSTVTKIGDYAFYGQDLEGISGVKLPEGLVEIGNKAFYNCKNVSQWTFPSTVKKVGDYAFCKYDSAIQEVFNLNNGLEFIGDAAFAGVYIKGEFKLPSTVKHIGARAFANDTAITKFTFPRDLETLGENPLSNCTGVLEIDIESGNTNFAIYDGILYSANYKTLILCPSGRVEPVNVKAGTELIGPFAFYEVDQLGEITFPDTVKEFGESAFEDCYHISSFTIPDSVTKIGEACFDDCTDLREINFGTGITSLPKYAFWGCTSLNELVIPSNIKNIGDFAFAYCTNLSKLTLSEGLESIGTCAFMYNWLDEYVQDPGSKIKTLKLPDSLTYLSDDAFSGHSGIISIQVGANLPSFPAYQFNNCDIKTVTVKNSNYLQNVDGLVLSKDGSKLYFASTLVYGDVEIPSGVTEIGEYAFYKNLTLRNKLKEDGFGITSIKIPSTVVTINEGAFTYANVGSVAFGSSLRTIKNHAFYSAELNGITFANGVEVIEEGAFTYCHNIKNIILPSSLKVIGEDAFALTDVTSLKLNEGLESIGNEAFRNTNISGVVKLPTTLKELGSNVFWPGMTKTNYVEDFDLTGNPFLVSENGLVMDKDKTKVITYASGYKVDGTNYQTSIRVPETVKTIGISALSYAPYLTEIILPSGLTRIEDQAFESTGNLKELVIPMSVQFVGYRAFNGWKIGSRLTFECSATYAAMHFDPEYLNGVSSKTTVVTYNG